MIEARGSAYRSAIQHPFSESVRRLSFSLFSIEWPTIIIDIDTHVHVTLATVTRSFHQWTLVDSIGLHLYGYFAGQTYSCRSNTNEIILVLMLPMFARRMCACVGSMIDRWRKKRKMISRVASNGFFFLNLFRIPIPPWTFVKCDHEKENVFSWIRSKDKDIEWSSMMWYQCIPRSLSL